jgi:hypothetical protein
MGPTLTLMSVGDELDALLPRNTLQEYPVGGTPVEGPFYEHVSLRDTRELLSFCVILRKSIIIEIRPNVSQPNDLTRGVGVDPLGPRGPRVGVGAEAVASGSLGGSTRADGCASLSSKVPGGSGAHADVMRDNSSATALSRRGM